MITLNTHHLETGEELDRDEIQNLLNYAIELKAQRKKGNLPPLLKNKQLALIFDKPSLRTRFSFMVAMNELGGFAIESLNSTRKHEEPEDMIRVLSGYCDAVVIRTHDDQNIQRMAAVSSIPVINGLSEFHHPCQILADLMTLKEIFGTLSGITLTYVGDGNNILNSLLLMAPWAGVNIHYSCPNGYLPHPAFVEKTQKRALESNTQIRFFENPVDAVTDVHAVYTDVWTSMGFEAEKESRERAFSRFQVNEDLMTHARKDAIVLHCLPMERGKEISQTLPESHHSAIFQQSENRLHVQKAILVGLMNRREHYGARENST